MDVLTARYAFACVGLWPIEMLGLCKAPCWYKQWLLCARGATIMLLGWGVGKPMGHYGMVTAGMGNYELVQWHLLHWFVISTSSNGRNNFTDGSTNINQFDSFSNFFY